MVGRRLSPDGRWLLIADEGAGHAATPGSVSVFDLQAWSPGATEPVPVTRLGSRGRWRGVPDGEVEPEYVAVDPQSRLAAVSCQEQDTILLVDLRAQPPRVAGSFRLGTGAHPDGVAVTEWRGPVPAAAGERPEGLARVERADGGLIITANEGHQAPGTLTRVRWPRTGAPTETNGGGWPPAAGRPTWSARRPQRNRQPPAG